jgi:hypothetical protein
MRPCSVLPVCWLTLSVALLAGYPNLNFLKSMELEHASTKEFTTPNYQITTYPAKEWKIVFNVDKKKEREYGRHRRSIPDWRLIMRKEKMQVQKGNEAPLTEVEVLAIILYTGPMVRFHISFQEFLYTEYCFCRP